MRRKKKHTFTYKILIFFNNSKKNSIFALHLLTQNLVTMKRFRLFLVALATLTITGIYSCNQGASDATETDSTAVEQPAQEEPAPADTTVVQ